MNLQNGDDVRRANRCEKHGLVAGPDGTCVLCRRKDKQKSRVASSETKSLARKMLTGLPGILAVVFVSVLIWIGVGPSTSPDNKMPAKEDEPRLHEIEAQDQEQDNEEDSDEYDPELDEEDQDDFEAVRAAQAGIEAKKAAKTRTESKKAEKARTESKMAEKARTESKMAERKHQGENEGRDRRQEQLAEREKQKQAIKNARDDVEIKVYITSWCPVCNQARKYMQTNRISFDKYDIEKDPEAHKRLGSINPRRSIPTFTIDGTVKIGFSPKALEHAINKAAKLRAQKRGW
ncbi:MAG: hypothetical protein JRJ87_19770 [Deltaproteobacteria bacterium]|nr:hypothetical protein [Deltaproteobacteria bacterium]